MLKSFKILLLISVFCLPKLYAQDYFVRFTNQNIEHFSEKSKFKDSLQVLNTLNAEIDKLLNEGYLTASVDSIYRIQDTFFVNFYKGNSYEWAKINYSNISEDLLRKLNFNFKNSVGKKVSAQKFAELKAKIIEFSNDNGYPFASVKLDFIVLEEHKLSGNLLFRKGDLVVFDSIQIDSKLSVKKTFLQNYLQIKVGDDFNQKKLNQISAKIRELRGYEEIKPHQVYFKGKKCIVKLYLREKKSNGIDGIAGFQQDTKDRSKLLFTGHFDMSLYNIAGGGKSVLFNWRKTDRNSQQMNFKYTHLSLFRSNVNGNFDFKLFKQDTSFVQRNPYLEFSILEKKLGKLKVFYELDDSRVIGNSVSTNFSNIRTNYYGLGTEINKLDDYIFPRKGLFFSINAALGNKKLIDSALTMSQYKLTAVLEKHTRFNQFFGAFTSLRASTLQNDKLYLNELFRLGGINSVRGFQENRFYASDFVLAKAEGRFFIENESYFLVFADYALYRTQIFGDKPPNNGAPLGIGAGISLSTPTGIFSFVYAVGKEGSNPIIFRNSVVNFGLTSKF